MVQERVNTSRATRPRCGGVLRFELELDGDQVKSSGTNTRSYQNQEAVSSGPEHDRACYYGDEVQLGIL
jgi:hypothetical protein